MVRALDLTPPVGTQQVRSEAKGSHWDPSTATFAAAPAFAGRKMFVSNLRTKDGRKRVPKLTILDSSGVKWSLGSGHQPLCSAVVTGAISG